jgi:hypothetical protein
MKVFVDGELREKLRLPFDMRAMDPRYNREYTVDVLYYDEKDYLIINKPFNVRIDGDTTACPTSTLYILYLYKSNLYLNNIFLSIRSSISCISWTMSRPAFNVGD